MRALSLLTVCCALVASACAGTESAETTVLSSPTTVVSTTSTTSTTTTTLATSSTTIPVPMTLPISGDDDPPLEVLFSLPVGEGVTYQGDFTLTELPLTGPQALTVDGVGTIWIADTEALRLIRFDEEGNVLLDIDTDAHGVGPILDIVPYGDGVIALEVVAALNRHRLVLYSGLGELLTTSEIPSGYWLGDGLTGIAVGRSGEIWIELEGGATVHEVTRLESPVDPERVPGYRLGPGHLTPMETSDGVARFGVGDAVVQIPVREFGSLLYEGAVPGAVALLHSDVVYEDVIVVDDTIVYVDFAGAILAEAAYPLDEVAYVAQERTAVAPDGRLIALVPRIDRLDVVSLTLYSPGHFGLDG